MIKIMNLGLVFTMFVPVAFCDPGYGVYHFSRITLTPPANCIEESLRLREGVTDVVYRTESGGRPLTLNGLERSDQIHRYFYKYDGLQRELYFLVDYKGEIEFHHAFATIGTPPSQDDVDRIRPVMFSIEKLIENQCDISGFSSNIEESCLGVKCR